MAASYKAAEPQADYAASIITIIHSQLDAA